MTEYASRHFGESDRPLRRDIRLLGWQLRRLVRHHGGETLWWILHELRDLAENRQQGDAHAEQAIADVLSELTTDQMAELTRAMGMFFDLANLAEDRHRVRVLRRRERQGRQTETVDRAAEALADFAPPQRRKLLESLAIEAVLTAHPTEAKRRSARRSTRRLRRDLRLLDRPDLLPGQRRRQLARMQRDLASLWYTDLVSARKPSVMEELRRTVFAATTLWRVTPRVMTALREAFDDTELPHDPARPILRFGNWIGGDRDGNPNVTSDVTRRTFRALRRNAVRRHRVECRRVRHRLTVAANRAGLDHELQRRIDEAQERWPSLTPRLERLHPEEWPVQWLEVIDRRLAHSEYLPDRRQHPMAYRDAGELWADVQLLHDTLTRAGHDELLNGALRRWRDRLATFGLHLLRLDIRVNSTDLTAAIDAIMRQLGIRDEYAELDETARCDVLALPIDLQLVEGLEPARLGDPAGDLWSLPGILQRLARADAAAIGNFIFSMTHQPSDILGVVWLMRLAARHAGFTDAVPIPVVPLFETIDDLDRAAGMLESLLDNEHYMTYVRVCDDSQVCMVGYSDSAKDGGYLASNWALYQCQQRLSRVARQRDVTLTIFHGRGGAIGRGGGPAARAILSLPPEAVAGRLRLTEQGEVIAERYDDPDIATRHLEQLIWATLTVGVRHHQPDDDETIDLIERLASEAERAYRRFVTRPKFGEFQRQCTALPLIEKLRIGSRPSRRSDAATLEDLRAIPFTFAWNQVRMPINAFYGLGAAFDQLDDAQRQQVRKLYEQWAWFKAVIDNAELALARCDASIARRYAALAPDRATADTFWQQLDREHRLALRAVLSIKGQTELLEAVSWLQRTIRVRTPYLDMLNLIQVELMSRQADEPDAGLDHALRSTVQAIAAGLRNTG